MKFNRYENNEEMQMTNIWDAFIEYVDSIYFPGASEMLDKKTLAFEYESFRNYCSM